MNGGRKHFPSSDRYNNHRVYKNYFNGGYRHQPKNKFNSQNEPNNSKQELDKDINELSLRDKLIEQIKNKKYECMICIDIIGIHAKIWSCQNCFTIFHLTCIQKWCDKNIQDNNKWECPICKNLYKEKSNQLIYNCFCNKIIRPDSIYGILPHSCGDICNKQLTNCQHHCTLLCHPGPCIDCEAITFISCVCGKSKFIPIKCNMKTNQVYCNNVCNNELNCTQHKCKQICHDGNCKPCELLLNKSCYCGKVANLPCNNNNLSCLQICNKKLSCNNHYCQKICHSNLCDNCYLNIDVVKTCKCGKYLLDDLNIKRNSCLDDLVECKDICNKIFEKCSHKCKRTCHNGDCGNCTELIDVLCRCGKNKLQIICSENNNNNICNLQCNVKLNCKKHKCNQICCIIDKNSHDLCQQKCSKQLKCLINDHKCELACNHNGKCPPCRRVYSWNEIVCPCGYTKLEPPIYCSQTPINLECNQRCIKNHPCGHPQNHACLINSALNQNNCPPCTYLMEKWCPGQHKLFSNVPCYQPIFSCGERCNKLLESCITKSHLCQKQCHSDDCTMICDQLCTQKRANCGHSCNTKCHKGLCELIQEKCEEKCKITCLCLLNITFIKCFEIESKKMDSEFIFDDKTNKLLLKCIDQCINTRKISTKLTLIRKLDQKNETNKYYKHYLEQYCKNNFQFAKNIEIIFRNLSIDNDEYVFHEIDVDKSCYIKRLACIYKLEYIINRLDGDKVNLIVKFHKNQTVLLKQPLMEYIENKYFKI